jgi:D-serine deaminase-like pyridoxal phosphate-dependent protein
LREIFTPLNQTNLRMPIMKSYAELSRLVQDEPLPCAVIDLDAIDANVNVLLRATGGSSKKIRIATKSIRCPELVRIVQKKLGDRARGLMTYTATETAFLANEGERDLLLAYPTLSEHDAQLLATINRNGSSAAVVVDCEDHLAPLSAAATAAKTTIPCIIEIDVAFRPLGTLVHLGVRRSPLRDAAHVVALAKKIAGASGLTFHGVMGYEAQIAGVSDSDLTARAMKAASRADVAASRRKIADALASAGLTPVVFNGGGSGSLASSAKEDCLTELTAGSGFLDSHLFDRYDGLDLMPAIFFALQVVRKPSVDIVTCHGGGLIASGKFGADRLPIPWLPDGLSLLPLEGAGEVQTPIALKNGQIVELGHPIFFRHAKAGELAEHFNEYLFVRGDRIEERARTYRGLGHSFLG